MGRGSAALLWLALIATAFLAPPNRPELLAWLIDLMTGEWGGHEPWVVAHFQLMGVWPALLALLLRGDGPRSWPFRAGAFALGCFALLPWLALRTEGRPAPPDRLWGGVAVALGVVAAALVAWAALFGSPAAWVSEASADGFVFVMAFDFVAFWLVGLLEARARCPRWQWAFVPVIGLAAAIAERELRG
ncbi:MAG: hypothetical protein ACI8PZ_005161 [Myxococcota bacterium]|jgi:hypothetical protein